jgi:hypothetical protein
MGKDQVMAVFLEGKQLLYEIQMCGKSSNEGQAQEKKDCPDLMLDAEPTPPVCRFVLHVAMSFVPEPEKTLVQRERTLHPSKVLFLISSA